MANWFSIASNGDMGRLIVIWDGIMVLTDSPLVMCDIDNMNIYRDISTCDMIWYKIIYYRYKLSLCHFSHMISKMTVFALICGFLKINVFEGSKLSNDLSNIKQLANMQISHM